MKPGFYELCLEPSSTGLNEHWNNYTELLSEDNAETLKH
jgi:hypothetical protein